MKSSWKNLFLRSSLTLALKGLGHNRLRTVLSVLGTVIGVAAVILIVSLGQGLQAYVKNQVLSFGANIVSIEPQVPGTDNPILTVSSRGKGVVMDYLKTKDAEALRGSGIFSYLTAISAYSMGQGVAQHGEKDLQVMTIAVDAWYPETDVKLVVETGRFFTAEEEQSLAKVALLGDETAAKLFGETDPIGQNVRLGGVNLQVIGVLKHRGEMMSINMDKVLLLPLKTSQTFVNKEDFVQSIQAVVKDKKDFPRAKEELKGFIRARHQITDPKDDDFVITTMDEALSSIDAILNALSALLGLLAAISLLVGGIGIMNIMLVIVAERTREIGLRKALGAKYSDIMRQFVLEALIITLLGILIGIIIGLSVALAASMLITRFAGFDWPFVVSVPTIIIASGIALLFGLAFGWYPAREAARLSPIEALRK